MLSLTRAYMYDQCILITVIILKRMWKSLGHRWDMEIDISPLHDAKEGKLLRRIVIEETFKGIGRGV